MDVWYKKMKPKGNNANISMVAATLSKVCTQVHAPNISTSSIEQIEIIQT